MCFWINDSLYVFLILNLYQEFTEPTVQRACLSVRLRVDVPLHGLYNRPRAPHRALLPQLHLLSPHLHRRGRGAGQLLRRVPRHHLHQQGVEGCQQQLR